MNSRTTWSAISLLLQFCQNLFQAGFQCYEICCCQGCPGDQVDLPPRHFPGICLSQACLDSPLGSVADNGVSDLLTDCDPNRKKRFRITETQNQKIW